MTMGREWKKLSKSEKKRKEWKEGGGVIDNENQLIEIQT